MQHWLCGVIVEIWTERSLQCEKEDSTIFEVYFTTLIFRLMKNEREKYWQTRFRNCEHPIFCHVRWSHGVRRFLPENLKRRWKAGENRRMLIFYTARGKRRTLLRFPPFFSHILYFLPQNYMFQCGAGRRQMASNGQWIGDAEWADCWHQVIFNFKMVQISNRNVCFIQRKSILVSRFHWTLLKNWF